MPDFVISVSYGNDSLAMIQWAHENSLDAFGNVVVTYCDTGWVAWLGATHRTGWGVCSRSRLSYGQREVDRHAGTGPACAKVFRATGCSSVPLT